MTVPRTDLALEAEEDLTAAGRFAALGSGVSEWECVQGGCPVTHIRVRDRDAAEALGRVCAMPTVSCPPAIPIVVSGETVPPEALPLFARYGIEKAAVVKE